MNMLVTTDPLDIQHILCKNFSNYSKGDRFREIFDVLGDGIFTSEGELWEIQRKITMSLFKHPKYQSLLETIPWNKVENGLLPILESISQRGMEMDLHEIFERFAFDTTCKLLLDYDPMSLSLNFPYIPCQRALIHYEEAILHRHYTPPIVWKLKQLFRWGSEKKLRDARRNLDDFIYKCLAKKHYENNNMNCDQQENSLSLVTYFTKEIRDQCTHFGDPTKLLRDNLLSLMAAGKDTISSALSWFFYLLAKNPTVEHKILEEIHKVKQGKKWNEIPLREMVYLHSALNESLRLFPPVPFNHKCPLQSDILPSGHKVDQNTKIILSFYSMGRMKSIWGEDCMEFKPERWASKGGGINHEPSYKFTAFNAGPRTCLGKDISFFLLKIVSASIIYRYHVELVEGHCVVPADSIVLQMKHGLKGDPECMQISGFMHGVNNPKLTKRLNEHVPKTMEEIMITTTAFIRGEAAAASKKKGKEGGLAGSPPYKDAQRNSCGRGSQIEELVRAGKLSHLIKEIKHGRDQSKAGKKETSAKDKPATIYIIQSWQRMTRQKMTQSFERVREITFPPLTTSNGVEGPLIIEAELGGHMIHRMYVDGGSSMEILYEQCFNRLPPEVKNQMVPTTTSLTGFSGETIWPLGQLRLLPYNDIIGRPGIKEIQAVPSTAHGMLKFPVDGGIVTICSTILIPAECATVITSAVPKEVGARPENFKVALHPDFPDQEVAIRGTLSAKGRTKLCSLVNENLDIFAWQPADMTGVPRSVVEHRLNIREYSPVRQKKRGQASKCAKAIQAEVQKLVEAWIMREFYYHDWLSNSVMVKKHDGSWRMCVDFTYLNKAYPQDCYPLPEIDWKVESLCGYPFKYFLDAYKGYHQIQLVESDEEKTTFHTSQGVYCYTKMPFSLKNAGATYQRLVDKAFNSQIGRNIEVYVDDLVVKSHTEAEMLRDIGETFRTLRRINMKLNPKTNPRDFEGRLQKWSVMLEEHNITYRPRTSVKGQDPWTLFTDGSSCVNGSGVGLILTSQEGTEFTYALRFQFAASNNKAEYEALIDGLWIAAQMGVQNVHVSVDSKLGANQVLGTYVAKEENMIKYLEKAKSLVSGFTNFSISQVPRSKNKIADALRKIASTSFAHLSKQVLVEILKEKPIQEKEVTTVVEENGPTWMTPIMEYLKEGTLPSDRKEARKLCIKARQYELLKGVLYRRSFLTSWLRLVTLLQADAMVYAPQDLYISHVIDCICLIAYINKDFQDILDGEKDTRSSQECMNDLEMEFHKRALLAKSKRFFKKGTQRNQGLVAEAYEWDEDEVSSGDNEMVEVNVLMALTADESGVIGKESAKNGEEREAFVFALESVTQLLEYLTLDLLSIIDKHSRGILSRKLPPAAESRVS
nr:cytochrome P450 [Tanacetum cinerariifolium]